MSKKDAFSSLKLKRNKSALLKAICGKHTLLNITGDVIIKLVAYRPAPEVTWRRANGTLPPKAIFLNDNYELVIPNATFRDTGRYDCIATNSQGSKTFKTRIVVQCKLLV